MPSPFYDPKRSNEPESRPRRLQNHLTPQHKAPDMRVLNHTLDGVGIGLATGFTFFTQTIPMLLFVIIYWFHKRYAGRDVNGNRYYVVKPFGGKLFTDERRFVKGKGWFKKPAPIPPHWQKWLDFQVTSPPQQERSATYRDS